jgi:hypothetical protein
MSQTRWTSGALTPLVRAEQLDYSRFKRLRCKSLPCVLKCQLVKERFPKPALDAYMSRFGDGPVAFDHAKAYLTGARACNRGKELVLQLRTGSLPLASHTGKFSHSRRNKPSDSSQYCCPV